eukprot:1601608-Amphidinium_carterae.1
MKHPDFDMYLLPQSITEDAWIWFEASTGATTMDLNGELVSGSWVPFNRILCFAASLAHQVHAVRKCSCLVLYRTARTPKVHHIQQLAALNFPLSTQELNILAADEEHPSVADDDSAEERESRISSEHTEQRDINPVTPVDVIDQPLGAGDVASMPGAAAVGQCTEVLQLLKKKSDGSFRTIMLQVSVGSTVDQGIAVLKRFLQHSASRIMLSRYVEDCQAEVLAGDHILSPLEAPYQALIKPSKEHYARPVVGRPVSALDKTAADSRPVIGARKAPRTASRSSGAQAAAGMTTDGAAASSLASDRVAAQHVGPISPLHSATSTSSSRLEFEQWVKEKVNRLEQQQAEILTLVRRLVQPVAATPIGATSSASRLSATPATREVIGKRRCVQGGMKRARESSRDSRASSSTLPSVHSLYTATLCVSHIDVTDEHIFELRASLCAHLQALHASSRQIAGHTVEHWAWSEGRLVDDYIADTAIQRPGTSSDLWLLASILGVTLWLYGPDAAPIIFSHPGRPMLALCVSDGIYS